MTAVSGNKRLELHGQQSAELAEMVMVWLQPCLQDVFEFVDIERSLAL